MHMCVCPSVPLPGTQYLFGTLHVHYASCDFQGMDRIQLSSS